MVAGDSSDVRSEDLLLTSCKGGSSACDSVLIVVSSYVDEAMIVSATEAVHVVGSALCDEVGERRWFIREVDVRSSELFA